MQPWWLGELPQFENAAAVLGRLEPDSRTQREHLCEQPQDIDRAHRRGIDLGEPLRRDPQAVPGARRANRDRHWGRFRAGLALVEVAK
jgi:hypothetical protein